MKCQICSEEMEALSPHILADEGQTYVEDYYCLNCNSTLTIEIDQFKNYKSTWVQG